MAQNSSGSAWIMAAVVLGIAIVGSSYMIAASLDRATAQFEQTFTALQVIDAKPGAAAAKPTAAPSKRPDAAKVYEVVVGQAPVKGPANATVTIVEFSDFQCPFCSRVNPTLVRIHETYPDDVRVAFKHMPLSIHPKAPAAHAAAEAAYRQGKFWEMHDKIFEKQREMSPEKYLEYAAELELDVEQFKKDIASAEVKSRIDADSRDAQKVGATGTPAFFVNGRFLSGAKPFEAFKEIIDEELADRERV